MALPIIVHAGKELISGMELVAGPQENANGGRSERAQPSLLGRGLGRGCAPTQVIFKYFKQKSYIICLHSCNIVVKRHFTSRRKYARKSTQLNL